MEISERNEQYLAALLEACNHHSYLRKWTGMLCSHTHTNVANILLNTFVGWYSCGCREQLPLRIISCGQLV